METKVLWIEDDYYNYQGLLRPLEKAGIKVEYALSALEGYKKARKWKDYALIVVDIILPLTKDAEAVPEEVAAWRSEKYPGVGLIKWLRGELKASCPVIILSVVDDPITNYQLESLGIDANISKRGVLPSELTEKINALIKKPEK
jgi:DNA-binding response OmpR family regulator